MKTTEIMSEQTKQFCVSLCYLLAPQNLKLLLAAMLAVCRGLSSVVPLVIIVFCVKSYLLLVGSLGLLFIPLLTINMKQCSL
jgi:hypothetical protein